MATKKLIRFAAIAALLLNATACKYPYDVNLEQTDYPLVIEGDLLLGTTSTFRFSYVLPLEANEYLLPAKRTAGYVEGENGIRVTGTTRNTGAILDFDTSELPAGQRYRLHLETPEGRIIESDWLDVAPAPVIDDLSYWKNEEYNELHVGLSMHCNGAHHFRWTYVEEWEYHSDIRTFYEFDPNKSSDGVTYVPGGYKNYYCWNRNEVSAINIFSTENQIEDRFEELSFHRIPLGDIRLQTLYRMTLRLEALSEDAYLYWRTIQQNTEAQGSLFAPMPSEMASNLRCTSDPSYQVLGYVNAAVAAITRMYYDNEVADYYQRPRGGYYKMDEQDVSLNPADCLLAYEQGFLPFNPIYGLTPQPIAFTWARKICIDCRVSGGTKNKPADWPTDHQ